MSTHSSEDTCPCSSGKTDDACCAAYISGYQKPKTPEALMRSRYTAYTQANMDYIENTMQGPARKKFDRHLAKQWAKSVEWLGLVVLDSTYVLGSSIAYVEFQANYRYQGSLQQCHEKSEFRLMDGVWYYYDGVEP